MNISCSWKSLVGKIATAGIALALSACGGNTPLSQGVSASLSAAPATVTSGGASVITWSSTNATSCTASGGSSGWAGTLATSGSFSTGPLTANSVYSLTCSGQNSTSAVASTTVTIVDAAVPTATLSVSPTTVASGAAATLTWSSTDAASCAGSGSNFGGSLASSGTQTTGPLTADETYTLVCTGAGGTSAAATATVTVTPTTPAAPTVTLSANPVSVASGGTSVLSWSSTNATSCTASQTPSGNWTGAEATSGNFTTPALTANVTYSLFCSGPGGTSATATTTVSILPAPTVTLVASPTSVASGQASTLTWSSTNATSCTATGAWTGAQSASGTQSTGALTASKSYSLTCTGTGGTSNTATADVTVTYPLPTVTLSALPTSVTSGGSSTLSWASTNASSCTASGSWSGTQATSGNQSTGPLTAIANYGLTCTGPGGTSTTATATVSIASSSGNVVVSPSVAALTLTQTQQFTATGPGGTNVTWSVDGMGAGNAQTGTISATGLYTTTSSTTPGTHTITATNTSQSASATAAVTGLTAVYTYHNDNARDGVNAQEYALTPANVSTNFGKITSCPVDGAIYAQPLWVANLTVNGAAHNVVFVATAHDGLFAFDGDASNCTQLWSANLIDTNHGATGGEVTVPDMTTNDAVGNGYGDISPEIGVIGTPVIDQTTNILYVVSKSMSSDGTSFYQRLHAIDITTGNEKSGSPINITSLTTYPCIVSSTCTGSVAFNPRKENQRPGLALLNGLVYIAWGSHEDSPTWYGWIMSYQYSNGVFTQKSVLNISPNTQNSGIWLSGGAPAIDSANNIYVSSGNGTFDATPPMSEYGDSLVQLTSTLAVSQSFTPQNQANDLNYDRDYGAGGITVLPDLPAGSPIPHLLVTADKLGDVFLLNRDSLGGYGVLVPPQVLSFPTAGSYPTNNTNNRVFFATGAFWNNTYYIASAYGPMYSLTLNSSVPSFSSGPSSAHDYGFPGSSPSISASSSTQNGIVWTLDNVSYCTYQSPSCGSAVLYAHDASNLGNLLWHSPTYISGNPSVAGAAGYAVKFTVPTIANGKVYVGTRGNNTGNVDTSTSIPGELDIFGLTP